MSLITIIAPSVAPVSAADVKAFGRIDVTDFDAQISILIDAMTREAEHRLGRRLITQTVELVLDAFPADDVDLLLPSVQSITSVKYVDSAGAVQTILSTEYALDSESKPCWLLPVNPWPSTDDAANAVRIRYVVGYGPADIDVPQNIRLWITAQVLQALDNPAGITEGKPTVLPYLDRLLDAETIWRAA